MRTAIASLFASLVLASAAPAQPGPTTAKEFLERGLARAELGFHERAIEDFTAAIKLDPKHARAYARRGFSHFAQKVYDKARADLDEAIKLDPQLAEAFAERGRLHTQQGEYENALKDYAVALKLEPKRAEWYSNRSVAQFYAGRVEESLADLDEAIRLDPKNYAFYINRAQTRLDQGTNLAGALKDAEEAIRLAAKEPLAHYTRGSVQFARGEWGEVRTSLDEAIKLGPNIAGSYIARAGLLACCPDAKHLDPKLAHKDGERACELTEWKDPFALEVLAAAAAALGDSTGAVKWQKKAMENPRYGRTAGAAARLAAYESGRVVRFPPPIRDRTDAREFVARGNHYFTTGEYDKAVRDFDEAIRLDPKSAKAYYGRGCARARRDEDSRAVADFTEAIKLDPKDTSAYVDRSIVHLMRGDWEKAVADCDEAVKLDPKHANALTNRAMIRAGCPDRAVRDPKKALADARQACDLTGWEAGYPLEAYAAACAADGHFDEAVKWQTRATADDEYMARRGPTARYRLQLFEAQQPFRLSPPRKPD